MVVVQDALKWLGVVAKDKVTQTKGVVTSIAFDLYGCTQVILTPHCKDDGSRADTYWYDLSRLEEVGGRVMEPPEFDLTKGAADKPIPV